MPCGTYRRPYCLREGRGKTASSPARQVAVIARNYGNPVDDRYSVFVQPYGMGSYDIDELRLDVAADARGTMVGDNHAEQW